MLNAFFLQGLGNTLRSMPVRIGFHDANQRSSLSPRRQEPGVVTQVAQVDFRNGRGKQGCFGIERGGIDGSNLP